MTNFERDKQQKIQSAFARLYVRQILWEKYHRTSAIRYPCNQQVKLSQAVVRPKRKPGIVRFNDRRPEASSVQASSEDDPCLGHSSQLDRQSALSEISHGSTTTQATIPSTRCRL